MIGVVRAGLLAMIVGSPLTCMEGDEDSKALSESARAARALWVRDCADCHGVSGGADGQKAAALRPPPPDFSDACRPVTDEWIERVILEGGASFRGNPEMKPRHELEAKPEVLDELVQLVQGFRQGACQSDGVPPPPVVDGD